MHGPDGTDFPNGTRIVLTARLSSSMDKRKHAEEFHAIEGARELLERLEEQTRR